MNFVKTLVAAAAVAVSCGANAVVTASLTTTGTNFASLNCSGPCGTIGAGGSLSGAITGTFNGGTVFAADMAFADDVAAGENFYAVGPAPGGGGIQPVNTGTLTLAGAGLSFISFLWGSPDAFNSLTVNSSGTGPNSQVFTPVTLGFGETGGNQAVNQTVSFTAGAGSLITSLVFTSTQNAFEVGRFSATSPVPEPETYALLLAGLGALGFVARRRRQA